MFSGCLGLKNIDLSCLDASELESVSGLFENCKMLKAVDLRNLDLSSAQEFGRLFSGCKSLQSAWFPEEIVSAKNMAYMFYDCSSLSSLDLSSFDTSNTYDMAGMFYGCTSLSSLDLSSFDTSRVRNMAYMFYGCASLSSLDLSNFDTSKVLDASGMFSDCDSLGSLDISSFDTSRMSSMDYMFGYFSSIKELKLGTGFSVNGAGESPLCSLPTRNACYREISWKNQDGAVFDASEIPSNLAGTYKSVIRLTDDDVRIDYGGNGYVYTGSEIVPVIDTNLVEGTDYCFVCSNNINAGMASVEITGIGEYTGRLHLEYEINKAMPGATAPSEVASKFGQRLAEVVLPRGWTWDNPDYVVNLNATGWQYGQTATFYPDDLNNYWTVSAMIPIRVDGSGSWKYDSHGWWWQNSDGSYPVACWDLINGSSYYFDARGYMLSGWQCIGGSWYWLGSDGAMRTGWQSVGGSWYWLADSGAMATGWTLVDGSWYLLSGSGSMLSGWQCIGGSWYWLGSDGAMRTGYVDIAGSRYHFADSGVMSAGWFMDSEGWYYANSSGVLLKSCWVGNYYLTKDGRMATDQWVGEYYVRSDGSWDPSARKGAA